MTIEDDIALLEKVPTLALLGRDALRILAIGAESRSVHEGQVLFKMGEPAEAGYIVETGSFKLTSSDEDARPVVVRRGTLLGELSLITPMLRPVTATAQELSSVMRISRPLFLKMLDGFPQVADRLRHLLMIRMEQITGELGGIRATLVEHASPRESLDAIARAAASRQASALKEPGAASGSEPVSSQAASAEPAVTEIPLDPAPGDAAPQPSAATSELMADIAQALRKTMGETPDGVAAEAKDRAPVSENAEKDANTGIPGAAESPASKS
jgi:CRP-like cAMP-binding protein